MALLTGAALAAGASLIGSGISAGANIYQGVKNRQLQREFFNRNLEWQDTLSKTSIQRRTADAKKAGLHPLFALGANVSGGQPIQVSGGNDNSIANAGQGIGTAVSRMLDQNGKQAQALQLKLLETQIGESDARKQLLLSEAARNNQAGKSGLGIQQELPPGNVTVGELQQVAPDSAGLINVQPTPQKTHKKNRPGILAGENAGFQEFVLPGGQPIQLPASEEGSLSEVLEAVPLYMWPGIIRYNSKFYGDPWTNDFRDFTMFGKTSKNKYPRAKDKKPNRMFKTK